MIMLELLELIILSAVFGVLTSLFVEFFFK